MATSNINPPSTYAEWVALLDQLKTKSDDEGVFQAMLHGTLEWQTGVAERFAKKLIEVINFRMDAAIDKFQKELARANGQERSIVQALIALRKELEFLSKAIALPVIPQKDREEYSQMVASQANLIQRSLEDSAGEDRSGKLASIVRNNRVNAFIKEN